MARKANHSLNRQLRLSTNIMMALLAVPVVISLAVMVTYAVRDHETFSRMESVSALKPLVGTELPDQVWSAVAGRNTFEDCGADESIVRVNKTLDDLMVRVDETRGLMLTVARRTMDTLSSYVSQIGENLASGVPIAESELVLEEVRDVASLVESMLEDYTTAEINAAAATNDLLTGMAIVAAIIEVLLLIVTLLLANRTTRSLARDIHQPISRLEHFAGLLADGHLEARVPETEVIELQNLTESVNIMADRLESLIEQSRLEQENLKKAELRTLQAQINPHFLYNTLDAIIWGAEAGNSELVIDITRNLSGFFRTSLSSGADWVTVSQEIRHLTSYLAIQKVRYRDILSYEVDVQEDMGDEYIPKLLLQPLVENALYHGIKYRRGGGLITVTARREDRWLLFSVQDTGRGMSPERLAEVRELMRTRTAPYAANGSGFGLNNVDQRIRLYYNQDDGLTIESGEQGTTVSFRVPVRTEEVRSC